MDDTAVRNGVVEKLLRKQVVGSHKKQADTVVNWFPSHVQGQAERVIRGMIADVDAPVEAYGGSRDNVRLTSVEDAIRFLEDNDGTVPFGYDRRGGN